MGSGGGTPAEAALPLENASSGTNRERGREEDAEDGVVDDLCNVADGGGGARMVKAGPKSPDDGLELAGDGRAGPPWTGGGCDDDMGGRRVVTGQGGACVPLMMVAGAFRLSQRVNRALVPFSLHSTFPGAFYFGLGEPKSSRDSALRPGCDG